MTNFFSRFLRGEVDETAIEGEIEAWHASNLMVPLHAYLGMTRAEFAAYMADARALARMRDARIRLSSLRRIGDFDAVMISNGEPQTDANFLRLRSVWPRSPHLVQARGTLFDAITEACRVARTPRVVIMRGDCTVRHGSAELAIDETERGDAIFCFSNRNLVTGIESMAGGMKVWPRTLLASFPSRQTDELAHDPCRVFRCWQMPEIASDSEPASDEAAFAMGWREVIRLNLVGGRVLPRLSDTLHAISSVNRSRLLVWLSVGADHQYGDWTVLGARMAVSALYAASASPGTVQDGSMMRKHFQDAQSIAGGDAFAASQKIGESLELLSGLPICLLDPQESAWFKRAYLNPIRQGFADITLPMLDTLNAEGS